MEHLEPHLGKDISIVIFEYLINSIDYTPFRYEDIVLLSKKITRWNNLLLWAGRNGNLDIVKYSSEFINDKSVWVDCAEEASKNRHDSIFFYIINKFDYIFDVMRYDVIISAGVGGHHDIISFIRDHYHDNVVDEYLIMGAIETDNLELFIECIPSIKNNSSIWSHEFNSPINQIPINNSMKILNYIEEHIDKVIFDINWTSIVNHSSSSDNLNIFRYSLFKVTDTTKICDYSMGEGGNMEILKLVENVKFINWDDIIMGASKNGHEHLALYALNKGANNWEECMIIASEMGQLSVLLLLEREVKEYINTAVWNKCMISAIKYPNENTLDIIKHCGTRGAYDWNECLRRGAYRLNLDIIVYAESMGADDFQECIIHMKHSFLSMRDDDMQNIDDYERETKRMKSLVKEHLESKLRMCRRLDNRRIAEILGWEKSI